MEMEKFISGLSLAQWGLICDFIGVLFLSFFGFPTTILSVRRHMVYTFDFPWNWVIPVMGWLGVILVLTGFALQFFSYFGR